MFYRLKYVCEKKLINLTLIKNIECVNNMLYFNYLPYASSGSAMAFFADDAQDKYKYEKK